MMEISTITTAAAMPVCLTADNRLQFTVECLLSIQINNVQMWWVCNESDSWDGASIPRWAWWLMGHPLDADLRWPSFWHDRFCEAATTHGERMVADAVFFMLLEQEDIPRWRVSLLWLAVRFYAVFVWKPKYGWANRKRVN